MTSSPALAGFGLPTARGSAWRVLPDNGPRWPGNGTPEARPRNPAGPAHVVLERRRRKPGLATLERGILPYPGRFVALLPPEAEPLSMTLPCECGPLGRTPGEAPRQTDEALAEALGNGRRRSSRPPSRAGNLDYAGFGQAPTHVASPPQPPSPLLRQTAGGDGRRGENGSTSTVPDAGMAKCGSGAPMHNVSGKPDLRACERRGPGPRTCFRRQEAPE